MNFKKIAYAKANFPEKAVMVFWLLYIKNIKNARKKLLNKVS